MKSESRNERTESDYEVMHRCRLKWLRELGQKTSEPYPGTAGLAAYARGFFDALNVALGMVIEENKRDMRSETGARVPDEPTQDMLDVGRAIFHLTVHDGCVRPMWIEMLRAARGKPDVLLLELGKAERATPTERELSGHGMDPADHSNFGSHLDDHHE